MKQVSKEEFFAAVNKAASVDPMPTREYIPIVKDGAVVGQRSNWETQRGMRTLFGAIDSDWGNPSRFFLQ